ncbi:MAG TPA: hypothetical protein ENJ13_02750 [Chromatiales bacterium]|nr:hypothetical protein [Chromatiales bacterium]
MSTTIHRTIRIENADNGSTIGQLHITTYSQKERTARAIKMLALMWGLAIITLFIPLAHFVLVPGFLIAGPVIAYKRYQMAQHPSKADGECPTCKQPLSIHLEPSDTLPMWSYCSANNDPVQLIDYPQGETNTTSA